jgi:hypothetical protein
VNRLAGRLGDYRKPVKELVAAGWTLTYRGKHPKLTCPAGRHAIPIPTGSPSRQMMAAWRAEVRRHGRICPPPGG